MLNKVVSRVLTNEQVDEIIVVDNYSHDDSMKMLQDDAIIKKIYRQKNHGFASSCNLGFNHINSEFILFLNPDCFIEKHTIKALIETFQSDPSAAIVGCMINNPDNTEQRAARRRLPTFWRAVKTFTKLEKLAHCCHCFSGVNLSHMPLGKNISKVQAVSGALIMMKSSVFREIKGFDEKFPLHFEDLDLFKRTRDAGYDILFNPTITAIHYQGTSSQSNPEVSKFKKIGMERYFKKHCTYLSYQIIRILNKLRR
jgi:GT2 family glycosyltransferase